MPNKEGISVLSPHPVVSQFLYYPEQQVAVESLSLHEPIKERFLLLFFPTSGRVVQMLLKTQNQVGGKKHDTSVSAHTVLFLHMLHLA